MTPRVPWVAASPTVGVGFMSVDSLYVTEASALGWQPGAGPKPTDCPNPECHKTVALFYRHTSLGSTSHWTGRCTCKPIKLMVLNS